MSVLKRIPLPLSKFLRNSSQRFLTSQTNQVTKEESVKNVTEELSTEKNIVVEKTGPLTLIGINRPEWKNALDSATTQLLCNALDEFEQDENAKVGVLHGLGGNFCAGFDLYELANYNDNNKTDLPQFGALANRTQLSNKPMVACLTGYTVGAGLELALMCDLRVAETTTILGFLNRRFGIPILCGGTVRLPAIIGYGRAMDLILTGRSISAEEALQIGLVNKCTTCGTGLGQAVNYAKSLVKFPQRTLLADRASVQFATFVAKQLDEALEFEKDNASHLVLEEGVEGAKKFVNKGIGKHGKFYNLTEVDDSIRKLDDDLL